MFANRLAVAGIRPTRGGLQQTFPHQGRPYECKEQLMVSGTNNNNEKDCSCTYRSLWKFPEVNSQKHMLVTGPIKEPEARWEHPARGPSGLAPAGQLFAGRESKAASAGRTAEDRAVHELRGPLLRSATANRLPLSSSQPGVMRACGSKPRRVSGGPLRIDGREREKEKERGRKGKERDGEKESVRRSARSVLRSVTFTALSLCHPDRWNCQAACQSNRLIKRLLLAVFFSHPGSARG